MPTDFECGFLTGLLVGEGHFGGDGLKPQVTLRMHARHESLFRWLEATFPGGKLYGPYHHGGRDYFQWMVRGTYLRDEILPLLDRHLSPVLDSHSFERLQNMRRRYASQLRMPRQDVAIQAPDLPAAPTSAATGLPEPDEDDRGPGRLDEIFAQLRQRWPRADDPPQPG